MATSSELSSLGIGKETTPGTSVAPTLWLPARNVALDLANGLHELTAPRARIGRTEAPTGTAAGTGGFELECDPTSLAALCALVMGAESIAPSAGNPTVPGGSATTLSAGTAAGVTVLPFTLATGYIAGNGFRVDAGLPTQEDFVIVSVAANNVTVTTAAKYAHATSAAVAPCVLAYDHTFTLASPRNSFTTQWNRSGVSVKNAAGCKFDSLSLSPNAKDIVTAKMALEYLTEASTSVVTPSFNTLKPIVFEQAANYAKIDGVNSTATVTALTAMVNIGLIKDFWGLGGGRTRVSLPEGQSIANGTFDAAFEDANLQKKFWGSAGATAPQSVVLPIALTYLLNSNDSVNGGVQYGFQIIIGKAKLTGLSVKAPNKSYITQSIKYEAYETANAAQDDIKFVVTTGSNAVSI